MFQEVLRDLHVESFPVRKLSVGFPDEFDED